MSKPVALLAPENHLLGRRRNLNSSSLMRPSPLHMLQREWRALFLFVFGSAQYCLDDFREPETVERIQKNKQPKKTLQHMLVRLVKLNTQR